MIVKNHDFLVNKEFKFWGKISKTWWGHFLFGRVGNSYLGGLCIWWGLSIYVETWHELKNYIANIQIYKKFNSDTVHEIRGKLLFWQI